jgi:hypothetical protein
VENNDNVINKCHFVILRTKHEHLSLFQNLKNVYTGCLEIRELRIQNVKDPVELEKNLEKKFALPEEDIITLIVFNT